MMKKIQLLLVLSITVVQSLYAQNIFPSSGSVGIGTINPQNSVSVLGNASFGVTDNAYGGQSQYGALTFPKGQIFFSNSNPQSQLYLVSNGFTNPNGIFSYRNNGVTAGIGIDNGDIAILTGPSGTANSSINFNIPLVVKNNGNVGIGTTNPDAKLAVNGTIHSKEVKVDLNVPGPDYVFEKNYNIRRLTEVENYIMANKHLPGIPSAKSMGQNGINIGELNMKMLQKIEELTLYLIEKEKQLKLQGKRMLKMEQQMKAFVKAEK